MTYVSQNQGSVNLTVKSSRLIVCVSLDATSGSMADTDHWLKPGGLRAASVRTQDKERDAFGVGIPPEESDRFHQQIANFKMAMYAAETKVTTALPMQPREKPIEDVPITEVVGRKIDAASDAVSESIESISNSIAKRHTSEIPKDIGGSAAARLI